MLTLVVAINLLLKGIGKPIIDIDESSAQAIIEAGVEIAIIAVGFWKNNSFSQKAIIADEYLHMLKNEENGAGTISLSEFEKQHADGKSFDWQGGYKGECVSLIKRYISSVLGTSPLAIGNAKEYWHKRGLKYIADNFAPIAGGVAQRGDIFVRTSGTYGHVGIVLTADEKGYLALEQNAKGSRVVSHTRHDYASDTHFLRPKNQKNINPAKQSINPLIRVNATIARTTDTHKENTLQTRMGAVVAGERVRCLTHGAKISIIQYAITKDVYATGCIPSGNIILD